MQSQLQVFFAILPISGRTELRSINTAWLPSKVQNGRLRSPFFRDDTLSAGTSVSEKAKCLTTAKDKKVSSLQWPSRLRKQPSTGAKTTWQSDEKPRFDAVWQPPFEKSRLRPCFIISSQITSQFTQTSVSSDWKLPKLLSNTWTICSPKETMRVRESIPHTRVSSNDNLFQSNFSAW